MPAPTFSLVDGGPLCRLWRRIGMVRGDGEIDYLRAGVLVVGLAWGPLLALALAHRITSGALPRLMHDWGVHARLLVAVPLFFMAERALHMRTRRCVERFVAERWGGERADEVPGILARAERLRDRAGPELLIVAMALAGSQAVIWDVGGLHGPVGLRGIDYPWTPTRYWYGFVSLPLFQFLVYRWLWRWAIWTQLLWRLSRLPLKLMPTHPDQAGGLGFVSMPAVGFCWVVAGFSAVQSGVWANSVFLEEIQATALKGKALVFGGSALLLVLSPLLAFSGHLWRSRFLGIRQYGGLATDYTRQFHQRWIEGADRDRLLGAADIQSLADLANSYNIVTRMHLVPFGRQLAAVVLVAVVVPMIPVALLDVPLLELLRRISAALMGTVPV